MIWMVTTLPAPRIDVYVSHEDQYLRGVDGFLISWRILEQRDVKFNGNVCYTRYLVRSWATSVQVTRWRILLFFNCIVTVALETNVQKVIDKYFIWTVKCNYLHKSFCGKVIKDLAYRPIYRQLKKLFSSRGILRSAQLWFQSYLSTRSFSVKACSHSSQPLPLSHGVPQGFVLGPLLFILYSLPLH